MVTQAVSVATLIVLLKGLCEAGSPARVALDGDKFTEPHRVLLEELLAELVSAEVSGADAELAALSVELGALDSANDREASALPGVLSHAIVLLDDDPALAEELEAALAVMRGDGIIKLTRSRYDAIGGHAAQRVQRMTPALRAALEQIKLGKHTLLDRFDRWAARAAQLSATELKRVSHAAQHKASPGVMPADLARLKRDTIRRLNKLIDAIDDSALSPDARAAILAPIQKASDDAKAG